MNCTSLDEESHRYAVSFYTYILQCWIQFINLSYIVYLQWVNNFSAEFMI